jgi:hypothetical protein
MAVFICWSRDPSEQLAKAVKKLLEAALQLKKDQDVFISGGIEKGVTWFESVVEHLKSSKAGIVCLTPVNLQSPWLHFESGALAMAGFQKHKLFTLLHGVTGAELEGPLSAYQATGTNRPEMTALVTSVAKVIGKSFKKINDTHWKTFEADLAKCTVKARDLIPGLETLFQRKTFNEPVQRCTDQAWLARYEGARLTRERLMVELPRVRAVCPSDERGLFNMLLAELDAYAMAISTLLLRHDRFKLGDNGELIMKKKGIQACCEDRRMAIRSLSSRLLYPIDEPQRKEEAVRFMAAETNEERKMIIHALEGWIRLKREPVYERPSGLDEALKELTGNRKPIVFRQSSWDLDRIFYYLLIQYFDFWALRWNPKMDDKESAKADDKEPDKKEEYDWFCAARDVELEVERYRSNSKGGSLTPLTYALVALQALEPEEAPEGKPTDAIKSALELVEKEFHDDLEKDPDGPINRLVKDVRQAMSKSKTSMSAAPNRQRQRNNRLSRLRNRKNDQE